MSNPTRYAGSQTNTNRSWSPSLWTGCRWNNIQDGVVPGVTFFDDFTDFPLPGTQTSQVQVGRYKAYMKTAGVWETKNAVPTNDSAGGIIAGLADTDGDNGAIGTCAVPFLLNNTAGKLWFEARIAITGIATNNVHIFCGLAENQVIQFADGTPLANADANAGTAAMIGFNVLEDGLGVLNFSYADRAAAYTNIQASVGTMAANTFKKVGFVYDPNSSNAITAYVDGVKQTTSLSATALAALTSLDVKGLGPMLAMYADSAGTSTYYYCDWIRVAQEMPN